MPKNRIKLLGGWSAWNDSVQQGRLIRPDGDSTWVLLWRRPEQVVDDEGYQRLRKDGHLLSTIDHPAVLRLLHVTRMAGEPVWVFEGFQGVSMSRVLDTLAHQSQFLPICTAVGTGQRVAQGVRAVIDQGVDSGGRFVFHPGAGPEAILVDSIGSIKVAGFSVETEPGGTVEAGAYVPHDRGTPDQAAAYGLGALLVHLISGECPGKASDDPARHDAMIRRATIRVLARPGEAVSDKLMDLIRDCLSMDPASRPTLERVSDILEVISGDLPSKSLRSWAPTCVPGLLQQQDTGYPDPQTAKLQRHVDTDTLDRDESSFEAPPVRRDPPREIPTVLTQPPIAGSDPIEGEPTPVSMAEQSLSIPTSETDVRLFQGGPTALPAGADDSEVSAVALDIRASDDISDEDWSESTSDGLGGWPLVMGALVGMVVAAGVGWIIVEHMVESELQMDAPIEAVETEEPVEAPPTIPVETPGEPMNPDAAVNDLIGSAPAEEEPEQEDGGSPEGRGEAEDEPDDARTVAPVYEVASTPEPEPEPLPPVRAAPLGEVFEVVFRSVDPSIDFLEVKCHRGRGQGRAEVRIVDAGRGPCRVIGHRGPDQLVVSAVLDGEKTQFVCFAGGQRVCE